MKRYYVNKHRKSDQQKIYYEEIKKCKTQQRRDNYLSFIELGRNHVELENMKHDIIWDEHRLEALEERKSIINNIFVRVE